MKSKSLVLPVFSSLMPAASSFMHRNHYPPKHSLVGCQIESSPLTNKGLNLFRSAQEAIVDAERICLVEGPHSERCKVAWDIVEELKAADAHDRTQTSAAFDLNYSPLVNGLDILSDKVDRKMDELKKLSTQLVEAGASDPEVERLIYASDEMKQILAEARTAIDQYR